MNCSWINRFIYKDIISRINDHFKHLTKEAQVSLESTISSCRNPHNFFLSCPGSQSRSWQVFHKCQMGRVLWAWGLCCPYSSLPLWWECSHRQHASRWCGWVPVMLYLQDQTWDDSLWLSSHSLPTSLLHWKITELIWILNAFMLSLKKVCLCYKPGLCNIWRESEDYMDAFTLMKVLVRWARHYSDKYTCRISDKHYCVMPVF